MKSELTVLTIVRGRRVLGAIGESRARLSEQIRAAGSAEVLETADV